MNPTSRKTLISNLGQRIDRLQRALKGQPTSLSSAHPPLKKELEDLFSAARHFEMKDLEELVLKAMDGISDSFQERVEPILTTLRSLATEHEVSSTIFLYYGPASDRLSDLRALASGLNAVVFQTESAEQCQKYLNQLPIQVVLVDLNQKKSDLQKSLSAVNADPFTEIPFLVCAKKPRALFRKSESVPENIEYLGDSIPFTAIESRIREIQPSAEGTPKVSVAPTLLDREQLAAQIEFFKRNISVWSFGWLDAGKLNEKERTELEDQLITLFRSSDIRGSWGEHCYIALLPHTDSSKAQIALEKFFIKALQPPVTPLRMAIVNGHAETTIEELVNEAENMLRKDASTSSEPALLSPPETTLDRTLSCLLLDDSPSLFKSLRELTRAEGLDIAQSTSIVDALEKISGMHPYQLLIVTDTLMKKEGVDWIRIFRETPPNNRIPILLIADPLPDDKASKLYEVGITHILHRPIDAKRLAETIYVLLAAPIKSEGLTPPGVLCTSEESKALLALSMVLYRETGLPLRLTKGWKDALNRLYQSSPNLVVMDVQDSPEAALTFLTATRDFKVTPSRGFLVILPSEGQAYRDAFESFDGVTLLDGPVDPQDIPAHVRIKLKLAPLRRYPPDDKRFQMEVSRVMQTS